MPVKIFSIIFGKKLICNKSFSMAIEGSLLNYKVSNIAKAKKYLQVNEDFKYVC